MRVFISTIAAAAFATASSALAADIPVKAPPPAPLPVPVMNWTGFYIGINGGYSWGHSSRDVIFTNPATGAVIVTPVGLAGTGGANIDGGVFGGQIGYNWQMTNWVFGLETDAQWTGQRGSASLVCAGLTCVPGATFLPAGAVGTTALVDQKLEWFGTLRGRVGVLFSPSWLLYVTGGGAYGTVKTDLALASFTANGTPISLVASNKSDRFGWTVGAGIEGMFASNWSAKLEYLYVDLGSVGASVTLPTAGALGIAASVNSRLTDHILRAGINYHFSAGPAPLMARY